MSRRRRLHIVYLALHEVVFAGAQTTVALETILLTSLSPILSIHALVPQRAAQVCSAKHFRGMSFGVGCHQRNGHDNEMHEQH